MATSSKHKGWRTIGPSTAPTALGSYFNNTEVFRQTATAFTVAVATAVTGGITASTGDLTSTLGHVLAPVGDVKLGTATAFATTQPVAAVVMGGTSKAGIAPVGAIATCGAVFASDTVVRKMIADGTASNVET